MRDGWPSPLLICTAVGDAGGAAAAAAAVGVAATRSFSRESDGAAGVLLADLRRTARPVRGSVLAATEARALEGACRDHAGLRAAARGRLCFATPAGDLSVEERAVLLAGLIAPETGADLVVAVCDPGDFRRFVAPEWSRRRAVLVKASRGGDRPLIALLAAELREEGIPMKVWIPPIGPVAGRRALAGLEAGGESGRKAERLLGALVPVRSRSRGAEGSRLRAENAQALPAVLGIATLVVALALILLAIGGAATAKGRLQRAADLAAISAARSMHDDFDRLFVPARLPGGTPNPAHLDKSEYLARARVAARDAAERNDLETGMVDVTFPDGESFAPLRVAIVAGGAIAVGDGPGRGDGNAPATSVSAKAEISLVSGGVAAEQPPTAEGGGYAGPLAYRQGKPMRPDVAAAFDRMAAAAAESGVSLVINSAYRSDAEQQQLWNAHPDPRWVAPPGTSLHRCGTELDLGPPAAYGWLATNAGRFGFVQRYSWEAWHYGFDAGPPPCSAEGDRIADAGSPRGDGAAAGGGGLPSFVPARFRAPLLGASSRYDISAALLAAQLMAESNFNPNAVSSVGAQGIAQFMPATAASYGLSDPFDPVASIQAQARMMSGLLKQFGSVELALAAYNAGPGAVAACDCVPPYPETRDYVARILALLDGAGELGTPPVLEVRLIG